MIDKGVSDGNTYIYVWDEVGQEYIKLSDYKCSEIIDYGIPINLIPGKTYRFKASTEGKWTQK